MNGSSSYTVGWILFAVVVVVALGVDLGLMRRNPRPLTLRAATFWTVAWTALALAFNGYIFWGFGVDKGLQFFQAWLLEQALSIDNVFVFLVIFRYFSVRREHQHPVLFWGILGAVVTRGLFIVAGVTLIARFHWVQYVLGAFLVFTAVRILMQKEADFDPGKNLVLRLFNRFVPSTRDPVDGKFILRRDGRLLATPLLAVLLVVEATDVMFAVDSIPAVLGVTTDGLIVYSSNIFAVLGLRSLFFLIEGLMQSLRFLKIGIAMILAFIGVKILLDAKYPLPVWSSLAVIAGVLLVTVLASLAFPERGDHDVKAKPPEAA